MTEQEVRRRVRLRDVAALAGVSPTTASFVLAGRDMRISETTQQRVRSAARELDYRPNLTARSFRTQASGTVALVTDTVAGGHYGGEMVRGALAAAVRHQRHLLISEAEGDAAVETAQLEGLVDRQVEGFVYATTSHREVALPPALRDQPVVLLNCRAGDGLVTVLPDEEAGGRAAAGVLLAHGHRASVWLVGATPADVLPGVERRAGVESALAGVGTAPAGRLDCAWSPEASYDAVAGLLATGTRPGALVCLNDRIAFGAYQALADAGLRVPDDVSVVSFDDSELAAWLRPALTTVALPLLEMGTLAVELLLAGAPAPGVRRVPMTLRERGSVGPPAVRP